MTLQTKVGALTLAASVAFSLSALAASSGGGGSGGGSAGGAGAAGATGATGATGTSGATGTTAAQGNVGTGSTNPGLSAGTGSSLGNNATAATINAMMQANGATNTGVTTGTTPATGTVGAATTGTTGARTTTGARLRANVPQRRFLTRQDFNRTNLTAAGATGLTGGAGTAIAGTTGTTPLNNVTASNLAALGFTGGRSVTMTGRLFDVQNFFAGASGVPTLTGTPISTNAGTAVTNTGGTVVTTPSAVVTTPSAVNIGATGTPNLSGSTTAGNIAAQGGAVTQTQDINSPGHVGFPGATSTGGSLQGVSALSQNLGNPGSVNLPPAVTVTGGGVTGTPGVIPSVGTAQPGVSQGSTFVGANQVGVTGNTLGAVTAGTGMPAGTGVMNTGVAGTGAATNALGNLMFLQTATGPILVAQPPGTSLSPTGGSMQLQGQLFQRGPFRLLVLNSPAGTTGVTTGTTGVTTGTTGVTTNMNTGTGIP